MTVRRLCSFLSILLMSGSASTSQAQDPTPRTVVYAARVLDVVNGRYQGPSALLIRGTRIADLLPRSSFTPRSTDTVIDLGDATLLPGLIDAHVHLTIGGRMGANATAALNAGFTTLVDLGARGYNPLRFRDSINAGLRPGPRVLAAGLWIGAKNGVCEFNGIGIAGGPDLFRQRVQQNDSAGADVTKLCITGWPATAFNEPLAAELDAATIAAVVAESHARHKIVLAHDIGLRGVQLALDARVDGLAHAALLDSATVARMAAQKMFMIPTLESLTAGDTSPVAAALYRSVALAYRRGVPLVFGTDGGVLPHGANAKEFSALARAGVSPIDAIRTATINSARVFGLADSVGTIIKGKIADLIAVRGDPLTDIHALESPFFVMARGVVVPR